MRGGRGRGQQVLSVTVDDQIVSTGDVYLTQSTAGAQTMTTPTYDVGEVEACDEVDCRPGTKTLVLDGAYAGRVLVQGTNCCWDVVDLCSLLARFQCGK